jgi:hypothetical protein
MTPGNASASSAGGPVGAAPVPYPPPFSVQGSCELSEDYFLTSQLILQPAAGDLVRPVLVENSATGAELGFHAACRYSLISPASLARRWIPVAEPGKTMTSGASFGARSSMPSPWWLRPVL